MSTVHVILPDGVDDPTRPSGGNLYDRRACGGLSSLGWVVREHRVTGDWPRADGPSRAMLSSTLADVPEGAVVLLDGLVASAAPEVVVPEANRFRLVVLLHLPLCVHQPVAQAPSAAADDERSRECAVLHAAAAVVATSRWTRDWLLTNYRLAPRRVLVVPPGVEPAELATGSASGGHLLCVGAVTPTKGHDVLVEALAEVVELEWTCRCVGSVAVDPAFADRVRQRAGAAGLGDRIVFTGARVGGDLDALYAAADLVVVPSRMETYGMVVTEALARGVPVIGTDVGGLAEALGRAPGAGRPGILVPAEDPAALAVALRRWLTDAGRRQELRRAARERGATLSDWSVTAGRLSRVLSRVPA
jgi:glycosyltransferase involved in cell wall biosynthesis